MESLKELLDARARLTADARKILDGADAEKRDLNTEERAHYDGLDAEIEALTEKIDARRADQERRDRQAEREAKLGQDAGRQVPPGSPRNRGGDGVQALTFDFGRAGKVELSPRHPLHNLNTLEYQDAFLRYLRGESRDWEQLGLKVGDDARGGYLAPMAFVAMLVKFLDDEVFVRQLATVLPPTSAKSVGVLSYDTDYDSADWTAEIPASDISEDDDARFGGREMIPHLLTKLVKASQKLVRSSTLNISSFVASRLAYKFGTTEENACLNGSGSQQPLGVFTASTQGITTSQDMTASATTSFTADNLIDTLYDLKDAYVARATWIGSREFRRRCRKLKDGEGRYLLVENQNGGMLTTLLDRPLRVSEFAPSTFTASQYVAVVGDFSHYWIQDGLSLEIQNLMELFALRNQVGWLARKETDAQPVLAEAFRRLKLGS